MRTEVTYVVNAEVLVINRDSKELRAIVAYAVELAKSTNWDALEVDKGTEGIKKWSDEIVEIAIAKAAR